MAGGGGPSTAKKKKTTKDSSETKESSLNPETLERKRLKTLAFSNKILSQNPAKPNSPLGPSKLVSKHHGRDIVKKSNRKNRFLFSFPGLFAPISGGKIGELKDLGSKNPILYMDFPQGRMKLFGTIVYPKNRYLTLQFPRGGKNVMCEDYFDNMIVFSEAWWIGSQDENPEESKLDFPKELSDGEKDEHDFKGGAGGVACTKKKNGHKTEVSTIGEQSPTPILEDDLSEDEDEDLVKLTPVRQSARTAGKKFKFAEASPEEDSIASDADESEDEKITIAKRETVNAVIDIDDEDPTPSQGHVSSETQPKKQSMSSIKMKKSVEDSSSNRGPLVQTTISTLFKKVEEKKTTRTPKKVSSPKASGKKAQQIDSKRKSSQDGGSVKKAKVVEKNTGGKGKGKKKVYESEEDDIEEFSSASQDDEESDEDWEA